MCELQGVKVQGSTEKIDHRLAKLQSIRAGRAKGMSLNMGACNATFNYVKIEAVLMYLINEGRIDVFDTKIRLCTGVLASCRARRLYLYLLIIFSILTFV